MRLLITGWLLGVFVLLGYPIALVFWLMAPIAGLIGWALFAIATPGPSQRH